MPLWSAFVGPSYTMRSPNLDTEATINLFAETIESAGNAKRSTLYGTPGLLSVGSVATARCRGMFSQETRTFAVIGATLYELTLSGSGLTLVVVTTSRGTIVDDGLPVFFASNGPGGNQLAISGGGQLKIFNLSTNVLSAAISLPLTNAPGPIAFINSYFVLVEVNTLKVWFSANEDGTTWNGLDFFARSNTSDNVVGLAVAHDLIRVFGSKTSELYYNAGEADYPFLPYAGSISMDGAVAATGIGVIGETFVWVSKNQWDVVRVMQAGTGEPTVLSTPPVEFALAGYSSVTDVELLTYEQEGHAFAIWTFPTADVTWAFDLRERQWHQRARWDGTLFHRWRVRGACAPGSQVILCGDYLTGDLYILSLDTFTDNCVAIRRLRRAPYLSEENQWLFLDQVELGTQSGVGAGTTSANANVLLRVSRDNGNTYSSSLTASRGVAGAFNARAIWRRLGRARADRLVLEVSSTDSVRCVFGPGLWIRSANGSGEL